jgi:outer membrane biosynthesis protein TonB
MGDLNNDIQRYLKGEMTPAEMHALEKKALSDPFLADALEGATSIRWEDFENDIDEITERVHPEKNYTLRIAASIVVLIGLSLFFLWPREENVEIAKQQVKKENPVVADSIKKEERKPVEPEIQKPKQEHQVKQDQSKRAVPDVKPVIKNDTTNAPLIAKKEKQNERQQEKPATHLVTGTVTTFEDKLPLPGVTVLIKGTNKGTTTDVAGNYAIDVADTSSLVFSFVGMQTREMNTTAKSKVDVKMSEDVSQLSEVVIARSPMPKREETDIETILAEPVGGIKAYDKYLEDSKQYPQQALDNDVKGRVIIGFDVGLRGELSNFVVIRSLGYGCDDEVIRLIKEGPAWNPTTESNVPVESTVHVKMKFDAAKFKKKR